MHKYFYGMLPPLPVLRNILYAHHNFPGTPPDFAFASGRTLNPIMMAEDAVASITSDWINNWKQYFKQFYVDDILIIPSWEEVKPEDRDKMIIHIDPGTAFGTGMHETTQLCIRQLKKYVTKDTELEEHEKIDRKRMAIYNYYHEQLRPLAEAGKIEQPVVPEGCVHNAHMYFIKARNLEVRTKLIKYMKERGVMCVFHYVPLHTSPAGQKFGVFHGEDKYTTKESERLMRLPMFYSLSEQDMAYVVECLMDFKEW